MPQQKSIEKLNDFWLRVLGIPLLNVLNAVILYYRGDATLAGIPALKIFFTGLVITVFIWEVNRRILIYFRRKLPEIHQTLKRILFSFAAYFTFSLLLFSTLHFYFNYTLYWNRVLPISQYYYNVANNTVFTLIVGGSYEIIYYFKKWKETMAEGEQLKKENLQSQLDALKSHINPHFLFNSLNTLEGLAEEKNEKTTDFIRQLASVYRFILQSTDKQLCSLKEELDCIQSYSFLLKTRFGNNIHFDIIISNRLFDLQIPPLTLQMLVENAMKHNIVSGTKPLRITVQEEVNFCISVCNNLQKKTQTIPSNKIGLNNIQKRYELIGKRNIQIEETSSEFKVTVPLIKPGTDLVKQ